MNRLAAINGIPKTRHLIGFVLLVLLALAGNYSALSIGFNVDFIFGSVFGIMAVVLLGARDGFLVSLAGASYTFILWNHPYAIIIFCCEALWIALILRWKPAIPLVIIDLAYWCVAGAPLVLLFYSGIMKLGITSTGTIALKQSLNGICNATLASILLNYLPLWKWLGVANKPLRRFSQTIFESFAFILMVVCMGELIYINQHNITEKQTALANKTLFSSQDAAWFFEEWIEQHVRATKQIALEAEELGIAPSSRLQAELKDILELHPDFHNVYVADNAGTTVAYELPVNENGESTIGMNFSDRNYYKKLKETKRLVVSNVFMGRGGISEPTFSISEPILQRGEFKGFGLGVVNLAGLRGRLHLLAEERGVQFTLTDENKNVAFSTVETRAPLTVFHQNENAKECNGFENVFLAFSGKEANVPNVGKWQTAALFTQTPITSIGWTITTEAALAPVQNRIYVDTILNIAAIFLLLIATGVISLWFSGRHAVSLERLSTVTSNIPEQIVSGKEIVWPAADNYELAALITNFKNTADDLRSKMHVLKADSESLEAAVAERTAELVESEARLKEAQRISHIGSWELDCVTRHLKWSDEIYHIFEIDPNIIETSYDAFLDSVHPEDRESVHLTFFTPSRQTGPSEIKHRLLFSDGRIKWVHVRCMTFYGHNEEPLRSVGTVQDITEQVMYEQKLDMYAKSQQVLLQEVNHRVKNNLAMIVSLLNLESKSHNEQSCEERLSEVVGRVNALSTVHSMLSSVEWRPIGLREICSRIITATLRNGEKTTIEIAPSNIVIEASLAHNIALVMNELATNTSKHGTQDHPKVSVQFAEDEESITIRYQDNGPGYPPQIIDSSSPITTIGMQLITGIVKTSLYGEVQLDNDNGAVAAISFPRSVCQEPSDG